MTKQPPNDITAQDIIALLERQERKIANQSALIRLCAAYLLMAKDGEKLLPECHIFNELKEAGYGN